jgi:hypothetical protein
MLTQQLSQVVASLNECLNDMSKVEQGQTSASVRVRKALLENGKVLASLRKEILENNKVQKEKKAKLNADKPKKKGLTPFVKKPQ